MRGAKTSARRARYRRAKTGDHDHDLPSGRMYQFQLFGPTCFKYRSLTFGDGKGGSSIRAHYVTRGGLLYGRFMSPEWGLQYRRLLSPVEGVQVKHVLHPENGRGKPGL